jgi:acetolactate synthase-1/2/3 large subunit
LLDDLQEFSSIPIQPAWTAIDLVPVDSPNFAGRPSSVGDRAGGLIQKASDLIVVLGSSLSLRQVGFNTREVLDEKIIHVDIDPNYEYKKNIKGVVNITTDPVAFLSSFLEYYKLNFDKEVHLDWLRKAREITTQYRPEPHWEIELPDGLNPYSALKLLPDIVPEDAIFVCADASASVMFFQVADLKPNQRTFTNAGAASMGYELPAAIGAAVSTNKTIICLAGDGSFQQNLQELSLLPFHNFDIRVIYLDNSGYLSIRTSQEKHFNSQFLESRLSGLPFPDMEQVVRAFDLKYEYVDSLSNLNDSSMLACRGPNFTHLKISPSISFAPKTGSRVDENGSIESTTIADLEPLFSKDELAKIHRFLTS